MTTFDPHLDVEQLSAATDGVDDAQIAGHLEQCPACRQQVAVWRAALAPLREPPAAPDPTVSVDAALRAWAEQRTGSDHAPAAGPSPSAPAEVVPDPGAARGRSAPRSAPRLGRDQVRRVLTLAAVLLVAVAMVAGIKLAGPGAGSSGASSTSAATAASQPASGSPSSGASTSAAALQASTRAQLVTELRARAVSKGSVPAGAPCLAEARKRATSATGPATYTSAVVYRGVRGQVIVFPSSSGPLALVLRSPTCALLAAFGF